MKRTVLITYVLILAISTLTGCGGAPTRDAPGIVFTPASAPAAGGIPSEIGDKLFGTWVGTELYRRNPVDPLVEHLHEMTFSEDSFRYVIDGVERFVATYSARINSEGNTVIHYSPSNNPSSGVNYSNSDFTIRFANDDLTFHTGAFTRSGYSSPHNRAEDVAAWRERLEGTFEFESEWNPSPPGINANQLNNLYVLSNDTFTRTQKQFRTTAFGGITESEHIQQGRIIITEVKSDNSVLLTLSSNGWNFAYEFDGNSLIFLNLQHGARTVHTRVR